MGKTLQNRNIVTFYVRNEYKPVWEEFRKVSQKDEDFKAKRFKQSDSLTSVGIMTLIARYLKSKQEQEEVEEVEDEI